MRLRKSLMVGSLLFALVVPSAMPPHTASAVSSTSDTRSQYITMSPASTEIKVDPGGTYKGRALLVNQGNDSFSAELSMASYRTKNLTYDPIFTPIDGAPDVTKWITIESSTSLKKIAPQQSRNIEYTLHVPRDTPSGGYYAVLFGTSSPVETQDQGVVRRNRVGNILYITVNGEVQRSGSLSPQPITPVSLDGTVAIPAVVKNTGSVHFKTDYEVSVTSLFGKNVYTKAVPAYVLPQTERAMNVEWHTNAPIGLYKIVRSATLPSGKQVVADAWIAVINPLVIIGGVLIIIALTLAFMTRRKRHTEVE